MPVLGWTGLDFLKGSFSAVGSEGIQTAAVRLGEELGIGAHLESKERIETGESWAEVVFRAGVGTGGDGDLRTGAELGTGEGLGEGKVLGAEVGSHKEVWLGADEELGAGEGLEVREAREKSGAGVGLVLVGGLVLAVGLWAGLGCGVE